MAFRFTHWKWFYTYAKDNKDLEQQLIESKDPILKRYVIYVRGFEQFAEGITGQRHWGKLLVLEGQGWESRPAAWEWMKRTDNKSYRRKGRKDEGYGSVGAAYVKYHIMRLDKYFKYISSDKAWYEKATCQIPDYATCVDNQGHVWHAPVEFEEKKEA